MVAASAGIGGRYPDYFPHIPSTVAGAIRLQLEFKAEEVIGREQRFKIRTMPDSELLQLIGYSGDAQGKARFAWREQNWTALLCKNLGVKDANLGGYGGPPLDKPFVEGAPIYFPLYVKYYDELFRSDPDRVAVANYDTSKCADTLIREWWDSEHASEFSFLKEEWLSANAIWLFEHTADYDPAKVLAELLGIDVSELPDPNDTEAVEALGAALGLEIKRQT